MFDIGFLELVLVGIVALLVLGPERLPHAARMTGAFLGRLSRMVQSVRDEVEREVNIHEMQQRIKKQVEEGMMGDLRKELTEAQKAIQEGFTASTTPPPASPRPANNDALEQPEATPVLPNPATSAISAVTSATTDSTTGATTPDTAPPSSQKEAP